MPERGAFTPQSTSPAIHIAAGWSAAWRRRAGLLAVLLLTVGLGATQITNEGYVTLQGDMPRHLMNGVYFLDLVTDRPFHSLTEFVQYTEHYYARYPALSLGHHPFLLPLAEAPVYALFGVSVASARLLLLVSFLIAVAFLYLLVADLYGLAPGVMAGALFATSPFVVTLARSVLTEVPTLALLMMSAYFLRRFCTTERRAMLIAFAMSTLFSLYSKQLAIFVLPAFLVAAAAALGVRRLLRRDILIAVTAIVVLALPLVPLTFVLSRSNVSVVTGLLRDSSSVYGSQPRWIAVVRAALQPQLGIPVLLLALVGTGRSVVTRDRRGIVFLVWIASVLAGVLLVGREDPARYSVYWVPALCAMASTVATGWSRRLTSGIALAVVLVAAGLQTVAASRVQLVGANGYEQAAQFVLDSNPGPTVLFSGPVDTGFFAFFVRKHDAGRRLVVLRSDKLLTTSLLGRPSVEDRIQSPTEIYELLQKFGTRYVVIEDRPSRSKVLEWLRGELRSPRFVERKRIPIQTADRRLRGVDLAIYEFVDRTPPASAAILSIHVPLVGRDISVQLSDLIERKYLR